jgi:TRAP-type C4-dicarboxylate transport system permease small subunit
MLREIEEWGLIISLCVMSILAFYQVVTRYIFTSLGFPWVEELVRHFFVLITFIGAAVVMRKKGHQGVEILSRWVPPRIKPYLQLYADLCSFIFASVASYASLQLLLKQKVLKLLTTSTRIPSYIITIPIVLGFILITYYLVRDLIVDSQNLSRGKSGGQK